MIHFFLKIKKYFLFSMFFFFQMTQVHAEDLCQEVSLALNLESAISRALNFNRQILNSRDASIAAEYQVTLAAAEFDLNITPYADLGYVGGDQITESAAAGVGTEFCKKFVYGTRIDLDPFIEKVGNKFSGVMNGTITQPLLRGLRKEYNLSNLRGAEFALRTANCLYFIAQCQLVYRTISCLYDYIKAEKNVILNAESLLRVEKFYKASILKTKIGLCDPLDVYRAENELHQAEDALKAAQDKFQETEDTLRDLLALPMDAKIEVKVPLFYSPKLMDLEEAVAIALKNRIEVDYSYEQKSESIRLSMDAKERLLPEVNLVFNYNNWGIDQIFTNSWEPRQSSWGIGLTTSTNFNLCAQQAAYDQSLLAIDKAGRGIDQTEANITFEVKRALRNLDRTLQRMEIQDKQIKTAEGELRLAKIKFDRGMGNNFDLIQAEKSLRTAQIGQWNALIDHILGEYQLRAALGLLIERPHI